MANENNKNLNESFTPHQSQRPNTDSRKGAATPSKEVRPNPETPKPNGK